MDLSLIKKLVTGRPFKRKEIENLLYEICDDEHSSCSNNCPVYALNKGPVNPSGSSQGCDCFKNGKKAYDFIKSLSLRR